MRTTTLKEIADLRAKSNCTVIYVYPRKQVVSINGTQHKIIDKQVDWNALAKKYNKKQGKRIANVGMQNGKTVLYCF